MSESLSRIPVMVLNWNGWEDTFRCLQSIAASGDPCRVWLIDNHSDVDRSAEARALVPNLRVLRWDHNRGWSGAYRRALEVADGEGHEFAFLLNNDSQVCPGFLSEALTVMQRDARLAAVGSVIYHQAEPAWVLFNGRYHLPGECRDVPACPIEVAQVNGAAMLVRIEASRQIHHMDERYFCYRDDWDWCWRVRQAGYVLALAPRSTVLHRNQGSNIGTNARYYSDRNLFLSAEHLPLPTRFRVVMAFTYHCLRVAHRARRTGDPEAARAEVDAVWDGWLRRFGPRRGAPDVGYAILSRLAPVPIGPLVVRLLPVPDFLRTDGGDSVAEKAV